MDTNETQNAKEKTMNNKQAANKLQWVRNQSLGSLSTDEIGELVTLVDQVGFALACNSPNKMNSKLLSECHDLRVKVGSYI